MGGLDSLRYFSIGISGITSLPREIGNLKRLDTIDISAADIGPTLPDEIGDLAELRYLSISACKTLKELPASLMKLKKLETVSFEHNSLCLADDSLRRWILSISPHALDYQSGCAASGVRQGGPARGNAPARKLALPGEGIDPAHGRDPEDEVRYYSPAGRRRGK
jgi:hypothetical protein